MSLSKARDAERKRGERAKTRLDILVEEPQFAMRFLRERMYRPVMSCEVCGFNRTVDTHHEGESREEHTLCPNCHAQITRGIQTLEQLL